MDFQVARLNQLRARFHVAAKVAKFSISQEFDPFLMGVC